MLNKVAGLARAIAILIAIVAAFVPNMPAQVPLVLLLLGIVAGFAYGADDIGKLVLTALGLGIAGTALRAIPNIGENLGSVMNNGVMSNSVMGNVAIAVGGALATRIIIRLYELVVGDLKGLAN